LAEPLIIVADAKMSLTMEFVAYYLPWVALPLSVLVVVDVFHVTIITLVNLPVAVSLSHMVTTTTTKVGQ
jgi:hypothetical protein